MLQDHRTCADDMQQLRMSVLLLYHVEMETQRKSQKPREGSRRNKRLAITTHRDLETGSGTTSQFPFLSVLCLFIVLFCGFFKHLDSAVLRNTPRNPDFCNLSTPSMSKKNILGLTDTSRKEKYRHIDLDITRMSADSRKDMPLSTSAFEVRSSQTIPFSRCFVLYLLFRFNRADFTDSG